LTHKAKNILFPSTSPTLVWRPRSPVHGNPSEFLDETYTARANRRMGYCTSLYGEYCM